MFKDERLAVLSKDYNVARFISFSPEGYIRHFATGDDHYLFKRRNEKLDYDNLFYTVSDFLDSLRRCNAPSESFNIRTFKKDQEQGNPFKYGLRNIHEITSTLSTLMDEEYYCILHETLDVNDGGLAGCIYQNGIVSISPDLTPRHMENDKYPTACIKPDSIIMKYLEAKHKFKFSDFHFDPTKRYEFSIHPHPCGHLHTNTILWEISDIDNETETLNELHVWPSRLSKHIGDKLYGLLTADAHDLPIPRTIVTEYPSMTPIFSFGGAGTLSEKTIIRPCPSEQLPGEIDSLVLDVFDVSMYGLHDALKLKYPDIQDWHDQMREHNVNTVLIQPLLKSEYSGAYITRTEKGAPNSVLVEGVCGSGMAFMVNKQKTSKIPSDVEWVVTKFVNMANAKLKAPTRGEWIYSLEDGIHKFTLVQLHLDEIDGTTMCHLANGKWHIPIYGNNIDLIPALIWKVSDGLDVLRNLIREVESNTNIVEQSILVDGFVGLTTHAADLLRKHQIVSQMIY